MTQQTPPVTGSQAEIQAVELQDIPEQKNAGKNLINGNLNLIGNVKVKIQAVIGEADISVAELFALTEGSSVKLDTLANAPIDLYLDNKLIAKGELVVVDDNFGVRVTQIQAENALS